MRRILVSISSSVLLLFLSTAISAQSSDYHNYITKANDKALIYRGKIERHYTYSYKGTYFAFQEDFTPGVVFYNKKRYEDVLINLNSNRDVLLVKYDDTSLPVIMDKKLVEWFVLDDRDFVNVTDGAEIGLEDGYYEVLVEGENQILKKIYKEYREDISSTGHARIEIIFDSILEYFILTPDGYLPISGKKTFVKLFNEDKKEINRVFKGATRVERQDKDMLYRKVMEVVK